MKTKWQRLATVSAIGIFGLFVSVIFNGNLRVERTAIAQSTPTPTPASKATFDQAAALAKLREQIKGHEQEPGEKVFKNLQMPFFKSGPAARLLAVMEMGYARSLGVDCTHCHVPEKWDADEKPQKQITRDMAGMMARINGELLKGIKNLKSENPTVNCTTCHRGEVKPALNLAPRT
ncbi:MAG TPA: c-type cytochrome [Pyrinomonadaceae bacterium]|jgi:hypothetical protein|nr:c-type cytochrome [Pyrinomonadaceae bacterium]